MIHSRKLKRASCDYISSQALHTKIVYKLISKLVNSQTFHIKIVYRLKLYRSFIRKYCPLGIFKTYIYIYIYIYIFQFYQFIIIICFLVVCPPCFLKFFSLPLSFLNLNSGPEFGWVFQVIYYTYYKLKRMHGHPPYYVAIPALPYIYFLV